MEEVDVIYLISLAVFSCVIFALVGMLVFVESKVVKTGDCEIVINDDEDKGITAPAGITLLSALVSNQIFLPSACGGGGSCGMCKCVIKEGGRGILPTELAHLSRKEKKDDVRLACQVKVKEDMKIYIPDEIFSIEKYHATVVSNKNVATFIKELVLELEPDEELEFDAGAYIQIDIPEYEAFFSDFRIEERFKPAWDRFNLWGLRAKAEEPVYRAYSLANPPQDKKTLKFTIRIATPPMGSPDIPPGVGSSYVFNLKEGDKVTLSGPYGEFMIKDSEREMCFVGGGAGMAPLRSQIRDQLLRVHTQRKMTFWYGARSKQEMFYHEEFQELEEKFDNFTYHVALSDPQPEDNWDGMTGFIHTCLYEHYLKDHEDPTEIDYYLCGPPPMIEAVEKTLDNLGVEPESVAYDKF